MAEKWIQKAIKKPGSLRKTLGVSKKTGKRANLALTLKKMHHK